MVFSGKKLGDCCSRVTLFKEVSQNGIIVYKSRLCFVNVGHQAQLHDRKLTFRNLNRHEKSVEYQ